MGRAVLSLLRSAVQPKTADPGCHLTRARQGPGLALAATADANQANGTPAMHQRGADQADAQLALIDGAPHWWPTQDPRPAAQAMQRFCEGVVEGPNEER